MCVRCSTTAAKKSPVEAQIYDDARRALRLREGTYARELPPPTTSGHDTAAA